MSEWIKALRERLWPDAPAPRSTQIQPLFGVRLTETHLYTPEGALALRDLRFINLSRDSLRVVDRDGRGHAVSVFNPPASPSVLALAEALKERVYPSRRARAGASTLRLRLRDRRPGRCPYCHDDLLRAEVECRRCGTGHHAECFEAHGTCAVLACGPHAWTRLVPS